MRTVEVAVGSANTIADETKDRTRGRILEAAFGVLTAHGYTGATTSEIAARAKVSKRELYALFGNKQGILAALIETGSSRMQMPLAVAAHIQTRTDLAAALTHYGANLLWEVFQPAPLALHRLAMAEAERSPEMARILDEGGRNAQHRVMVGFLATAKERKLLPDVAPDIMSRRFFALLWGDLLLRLLLRLDEVPTRAAIAARAEAATRDFLVLYAAPAP
jgi:AcrR family transcriptional regulator